MIKDIISNKKKKVEILIVEDSPTQALKLEYFLKEHNFSYVWAKDGLEALNKAKENKPDLIVSDIVMPKMDGYELCRNIKADNTLKNIPVILLTTLTGTEDIIKGLDVNADFYITKPYEENLLLSKINLLLSEKITEQSDVDKEPEIIFDGKPYRISANRKQILNLLLSTHENLIFQNQTLAQTQETLRKLNEGLEEKVREKTAHLLAEITDRKQAEKQLEQSMEKLRKAMGGIIQAITLVVERRDPYTAGHQHRVADLARSIATEIGLSSDQINGVRLAGSVHDVGKIAVPAEILSKPGKINRNEFEIIKKHPQVGYDILKEIEFPWPIAQIILQHHERMDGSGYPQGLKGDKILLEAKIMGVADVVEAMSSHRPYRPALGIDAALEEISKNRGILYDPEVVDVCLKLFQDKGFKFK